MQLGKHSKFTFFCLIFFIIENEKKKKNDDKMTKNRNTIFVQIENISKIFVFQNENVVPEFEHAYFGCFRKYLVYFVWLITFIWWK